jgi:hypothetical protein
LPVGRCDLGWHRVCGSGALLVRALLACHDGAAIGFLTPPDEAAAERWPRSFSALIVAHGVEAPVVKGLSARRISIPSEVSDSFASLRSQMTAEAGDPGL